MTKETIPRFLAQLLDVTFSGSDLDSHLADITTNPHEVDKDAVGLGNVPNTDFTAAVGLNTAKVGITPTQASDITTNNAKISYTDATAVGLNTTHRGLTNDPHNVTKDQVGLGNVPNVDTTNASNITTGQLPSSVIPPIALTTVQTAASEVAMLALTTEEGDVVVRTDEEKSYMRNAGSSGTMTDFTELLSPAGGILSVNGDAGPVVVLTTGDLTEDTNKKYVTDAQLVVLGNTSGSNSGDQIISDATITTTDITTNNVSTSKHGFAPKGNGSATAFLNGQGAYTTPTGSGNVSTSGTPILNDFARFVNGTDIEGRSYSEVKSDLSLNNVDNTSDLGKPISTATQSALDGKAPSLGADDNYVTDAEKTNIGNLDSAAYQPTTAFASALGVDDNYVTDAEKVVIGNTSGSNSGDQDLSPYELLANKDTDVNLGTSDTKYSSQNAVKTYVDTTIEEVAPTRDEWYQNGFKDVNGGNPDNDVEITFDNVSRTLTVGPKAPETECYYYRLGYNYTITTPLTKQIDDEEGLWVFYIGSSGLTAAKNPSHASIDQVIEKTAIVAYVQWDATNNLGKLMWEAHGMNMAPATHHWIHDNIGAMYREGMALSDFSDVQGDGDQDRDVQFSISEGEFYDEDIEHTVTALAVGGNMDFWYLNGTDWRWTTVTEPGLTAGTGRLAYNDNGTQAEVTNADFALVHIFATNIMPNTGGDRQYIFIQGQNEYGTRALARAGADTEINNLTYGTLPLQEVVPVATIILQTNDNYANSIASRIYTLSDGSYFVDWRGSDLKATGGSVTDHGSLAGLSDDDHEQYLLVDGTRAMSGNLDIGTNNITNVGTVDGIDIATDVAANTLKVTNATHTGDVTGSTTLTIGANKVNDTHIDWGTGANQVNSGSVPESGNLYYTEARVNTNTNVAANSTFTATPSTVITAGTNLSWAGNTLNATGGGGTSTPYEQSFTATASQTNFTLTNTPVAAWVWVNGAAQDASTWSISGDDIVLSTAATNGDAVEVYYLTEVSVGDLDAKLDKVAEINAQTGTTYTLLSTDNGKIVTLNNGSAVTVTVPSGLGSGFNCTLIQIGAGTVSVSESSTTINNRNSHTDIAGQYGSATLLAYAANTFLFQGDTA